MPFSLTRAVAGVRRRLSSGRLVRRFAQAGEQVLIADPVRWERPGNVRVGSRVFFGPGSYVTLGKGRLTIGSGVMFGPEAMIVGGDHNFQALGRLMWDATSGGTEEDIHIEDDVWCGARVLILRGVTVGQGAVIGAASVVNRSIPPFVVAAGNPCRPRRLRFSDEELAEHLQLLGWEEAQAQALVARRRAEAGDLPVTPAR